MNILRDGPDPSASSATQVVRSAFVTIELSSEDVDPARRIAERLDGVPCSQLLIFASPRVDLGGLVGDLSLRLPELPVAGCTTAGEIGEAGYAEDRIIALALPSRHFASSAIVIEGLADLDKTEVGARVIAARLELTKGHPDKTEGFAFLMVDGLSLREDILVATLGLALGEMPLFGGSAGDGVNFRRTLVAINGQVMSDAAVLTLVQTDHRVRVFSLDNLRPTDRRMVVTSADPDRRLVKEINAEPAGREYARIVGKDPDQLDEFTFAAHPVAVRLGESHHVRAIQRVNRDGQLVFFSAIEEGMVLTVARAEGMVEHLDQALSRLTTGGGCAGILACDCILRRVAAEQGQFGREVSAVLAKHRVTGFSTYGEQIGLLHVNQTMTGVALFAPDAQSPA